MSGGHLHGYSQNPWIPVESMGAHGLHMLSELPLIAWELDGLNPSLVSVKIIAKSNGFAIL